MKAYLVLTKTVKKYSFTLVTDDQKSTIGDLAFSCRDIYLFLELEVNHLLLAPYALLNLRYAWVAELVDARDLKSLGG